MILHDLQAEIIRRLSSSDEPAHDAVESLYQDHGHNEAFYAQLLDVLADIHMSPEEARIHFQRVLRHKDHLEQQLGRVVDFRMAILDYFTTIEPRLSSPKVVELGSYQNIMRLATVDELTGLYNRRFLETHLDRELNRARRYGQRFSIVFLDLDDFKHVNDTYGHAVGDEVLRCFSKMLRGYLRREDVAARYGGEEFVVIMPQTGSAGAGTFASRVLHELRGRQCAEDIQITFSGGIATYPDHGYSVYELLKNADAALYEAKLAGKNGVKLSSVEKRASRRYEAEVPVKCYAGDALIGEGLARDVSLNGLSLQTNQLLQPGTLLRLTVDDQVDHSAYEVSTRVVWAQKRDRFYRSGVRWEHQDSETIREIIERVAVG